MKLADSERVSRAVTMEVGAEDSVGGFDLKTARNNALFLCPILAESCKSCGELALVESVEGVKRASLGVCGLA